MAVAGKDRCEICERASCRIAGDRPISFQRLVMPSRIIFPLSSNEKEGIGDSGDIERSSFEVKLPGGGVEGGEDMLRVLER